MQHTHTHTIVNDNVKKTKETKSAPTNRQQRCQWEKAHWWARPFLPLTLLIVSTFLPPSCGHVTSLLGCSLHFQLEHLLQLLSFSPVPHYHPVGYTTWLTQKRGHGEWHQQLLHCRVDQTVILITQGKILLHCKERENPTPLQNKKNEYPLVMLQPRVYQNIT